MDEKEFRRQLLATFEVQLGEHIASITDGLIRLEKCGADREREEIVKELFRAAHSIKGAARAVKLPEIEVIAHRIEDLFGAVKRGEKKAAPEVVDRILAGVDLLGEIMTAHLAGEKTPVRACEGVLADLERLMAEGTHPASAGRETDRDEAPDAAGPEPETAAADAESAQTDTPAQEDSEHQERSEARRSSSPAARPPAREETIRVSVSKLDALMSAMGELLVARMRTDRRRSELKRIRSLLQGWERSWRRVHTDCRHLLREGDGRRELQPLLDFVAFNEANLKQVCREMERLTGRFEEDARHLSLLTDDMQAGVRRVRMVPIARLFDLFPRMVRDIAKEREKEVSLRVEGADTEVDRQVLEAVKDPLIHLVRNAVDHGIESPEQRAACGKDREGAVRLSAMHKGNSIVVTVSDDGAGIDLDAVRSRAAPKAPDGKKDDPAAGEAELLEMIFRSGFSTLDRPTALSGRGVGLDVVRRNLEKLHGRVEVASTPGTGAAFTLTLPLTLATSHVLLMEAAGQIVAVPSSTVDRILTVDPDAVGSIDGRPAVSIDGRVLPLVSLAQALELPEKTAPDPALRKLSVAVIGVVEKRLAFIVDRFHETQNVVVKSLGDQLKRVRHVSGATILGSGRVVILLNVASLVKAGHAAARVAELPEADGQKFDRRKVLVVDDSITTRTLEKNILESAGFRVLTAADGVEGWALIQNESFDAVVLDVDMPRMNGIELTEKVKKTKRLEDLPVLLVTSLESREDRIRGMEAGADAYITKGAFDQKHLLDTIERLVG